MKFYFLVLDRSAFSSSPLSVFPEQAINDLKWDFFLWGEARWLLVLKRACRISLTENWGERMAIDWSPGTFVSSLTPHLFSSPLFRARVPPTPLLAAPLFNRRPKFALSRQWVRWLRGQHPVVLAIVRVSHCALYMEHLWRQTYKR